MLNIILNQYVIQFSIMVCLVTVGIYLLKAEEIKRRDLYSAGFIVGEKMMKEAINENNKRKALNTSDGVDSAYYLTLVNNLKDSVIPELVIRTGTSNRDFIYVLNMILRMADDRASYDNIGHVIYLLITNLVVTAVLSCIISINLNFTNEDEEDGRPTYIYHDNNKNGSIPYGFEKNKVSLDSSNNEKKKKIVCGQILLAEHQKIGFHLLMFYLVGVLAVAIFLTTIRDYSASESLLRTIEYSMGLTTTVLEGGIMDVLLFILCGSLMLCLLWGVGLASVDLLALHGNNTASMLHHIDY